MLQARYGVWSRYQRGIVLDVRNGGVGQRRYAREPAAMQTAIDIQTSGTGSDDTM